MSLCTNNISIKYHYLLKQIFLNAIIHLHQVKNVTAIIINNNNN